MGALDQLEPIEKASDHELRSLQLVWFKNEVPRAYDRVPHYRKTFDAAFARMTRIVKRRN